MTYPEMYKASLKSRETYYSAAAISVLLAGMGAVEVVAGENGLTLDKSYKISYISSPTAHFEKIKFDVAYDPEILPELQKARSVKAKVKRVTALEFSKELFD